MSLVYERIDGSGAQAFWDDSPHATVFTHPRVLAALAGRVDWWLCRKGSEPVCLWPSAPEWSRRGEPAPWTMYVGPMWSSRAWGMPAHRWLPVSQQAYRGLAERILAADGALRAHLPTGLQDVRAFTWGRLEGSLRGLSVQPQYSAVIAGPGRPETELLAEWRTLRRRELRRARELPIRTRGDPSLAEVARLYAGVFARQRGAPPEGQMDSLPQLLQLAREGFGTAFGVEIRGRLAYVGVLLRDRRSTHLVLGAADEEFRSSGVAAFATLESIRFAANAGSACFDFDGANSPRRGDDKHSYGAVPQLYFDLSANGDPSHAA